MIEISIDDAEEVIRKLSQLADWSPKQGCSTENLRFLIDRLKDKVLAETNCSRTGVSGTM